MRMLGIDPGLQATGWGIVSLTGSQLRHHAHGIIRTNARTADPERLVKIHHGLVQAIQDYRPDRVIIEEIFIVRNPQSVLRLGMARGVGILVCGEAGLPLAEISARRVKQVVTGSGKAGKMQVAAMVSRLLNIAPPASDAADALAIAISGLQGGEMAFSGQIGSEQHDGAATPLTAAIEAALRRDQA